MSSIQLSVIDNNNVIVRLDRGVAGPPGPGVAPGGTTGQVLVKASNTNYDTEWSNVGAGNVVGPVSSTDNAVARFNGTTGELLQNSLVTVGDDGEVAGVAYLDFQNNPGVSPTDPGSLYWDNSDGVKTLNLIMDGDVTQQIGQETYYRVKASAAITNGQVVMFTGSLGNSGIITAAPATGLTAATAYAVMGVATEDIPLNGFGYITAFGEVHGVNTSAFTDGQILYLDPAVVGGLTATAPTAPNPKVQVAAVVHAANNGQLFVRPSFGGKLGQFEGDVQITSPAGGQLLAYDATNAYWKNITLTDGTAISISETAGGAITIANTAPDQVVSLTGGGTTSISGTYPNFTITSSDQYSGTVTSVGLSMPSIFTVTGSPVTTSGTLAAALATQTAKYVFAAPNGADGTPTFRALLASDIPALSYAPQTSGTSILYGNGSGGFSNVTVGTGLSFTGGTLSSTVSGTVTSVALSLPNIFSVSGSPVTTSGTLSAALASQTANTFLAAPNGTAGAPTFRTLVAADIPALSYAPQTSGTSILYGNGSGGFSNVTVGSGLSFSGGTLTATSSGGSVTSVGMTVPTGLTVTGSPITTSGTFAVTFTAGYSIPTTASQSNWDTAYTQRLQWDGGATGLTASTGRTSLGATTVGSNMFTLTNPSAVTFPRFNADNTVSALDAATFRTAIGAGTGSGTVTSVALTMPTGFAVTGSPVTGSGTLAVTTTLNGIVKGDGSALTAVAAPTGAIVGTTDTQTLTNKTFTGFTETVFTITDGASVDINPANGTIQVWTLGANRTPTATSFAAGQSVTLLIADGTAFAVTWSTIGVVWTGGSAPTLPTSGYGVIELWKVGTTVYGAYVGAVA